MCSGSLSGAYTAKKALWGSWRTAITPTPGMVSGPKSFVPPSSSAFAMVASTSSTPM
jgi:hypothetical protein